MTYDVPFTMNLEPFSKCSAGNRKLIQNFIEKQNKTQTKLQQILEQNPGMPTSAVKRKERRFNRRIDSSAVTDDVNAKGEAEENKLVINLSIMPIIEAKERLLTLGSKFCPTPRSINTHQLSKDVREGCRRVRL